MGVERIARVLSLGNDGEEGERPIESASGAGKPQRHFFVDVGTIELQIFFLSNSFRK